MRGIQKPHSISNAHSPSHMPVAIFLLGSGFFARISHQEINQVDDDEQIRRLSRTGNEQEAR